jgi:hypothetical protein
LAGPRADGDGFAVRVATADGAVVEEKSIAGSGNDERPFKETITLPGKGVFLVQIRAAGRTFLEIPLLAEPARGTAQEMAVFEAPLSIIGGPFHFRPPADADGIEIAYRNARGLTRMLGYRNGALVAEQSWAGPDRPDSSHSLRIPTGEDRSSRWSFEVLTRWNNSILDGVQKWPPGKPVRDFCFALRPDWLFEMPQPPDR